MTFPFFNSSGIAGGAGWCTKFGQHKTEANTIRTQGDLKSFLLI